MNHVFRSFPLALKMILTDPVNFILSVIPTLMALVIYLLTIVGVYRNSDRFVAMFRGYIYSADQATLIAKVLTGILIIFIFFLMSWTFVLVVGVISAPFNSLLSSRIEQKLVQNVFMDEDQTKALEQVKKGIGQTFKNEFKKLGYILVVGGFAFLLNLFPLFYPVGICLVAVLLAVQFLDYSWSRHNIHISGCLKDVVKNIFPYSFAGFIFLMLVAIPIVNAFVSAFATSYFTVLWLHRQNKIIT